MLLIPLYCSVVYIGQEGPHEVSPTTHLPCGVPVRTHDVQWADDVEVVRDASITIFPGDTIKFHISPGISANIDTSPPLTSGYSASKLSNTSFIWTVTFDTAGTFTVRGASGSKTVQLISTMTADITVRCAMSTLVTQEDTTTNSLNGSESTIYTDTSSLELGYRLIPENKICANGYQIGSMQTILFGGLEDACYARCLATSGALEYDKDPEPIVASRILKNTDGVTSNDKVIATIRKSTPCRGLNTSGTLVRVRMSCERAGHFTITSHASCERLVRDLGFTKAKVIPQKRKDLPAGCFLKRSNVRGDVDIVFNINFHPTKRALRHRWQPLCNCRTEDAQMARNRRPIISAPLTQRPRRRLSSECAGFTVNFAERSCTLYAVCQFDSLQITDSGDRQSFIMLTSTVTESTSLSPITTSVSVGSITQDAVTLDTVDQQYTIESYAVNYIKHTDSGCLKENDLFIIHETTFIECRTLCDSNDACVSFSFNSGLIKGQCYGSSTCSPEISNAWATYPGLAFDTYIRIRWDTSILSTTATDHTIYPATTLTPTKSLTAPADRIELDLCNKYVCAKDCNFGFARYEARPSTGLACGWSRLLNQCIANAITTEAEVMEGLGNPGPRDPACGTIPTTAAVRNLGTTENACQTGQQRCIDDSRCIRLDWVCDGEEDCPDSSDEAFCSGL